MEKEKVTNVSKSTSIDTNGDREIFDSVDQATDNAVKFFTDNDADEYDADYEIYIYQLVRVVRPKSGCDIIEVDPS